MIRVLVIKRISRPRMFEAPLHAEELRTPNFGLDMHLDDLVSPGFEP